MSRYSAFKYGAAKYGLSFVTSPIWALLIDWDGDGYYDAYNEALNMTALHTERGRGFFLSSSNDGFERMSIGKASVVLSNHDGRYNPYNASSPLYPNVDTGKLVQLAIRYGYSTIPVFTGVLQDISQEGYNDTVTLEIEDGYRWLADNVPATVAHAGTNAHDAIGVMLDALKWPDTWGRDLGSSGDYIYWWWPSGKSALEEIQLLVESELGLFWLKANGTLAYRRRYDAGSVTLSVTEDQLLKEVDIPLPWKYRKNSVKATGYPVSPAAAATNVFTLRSSIKFNPGQTRQVTAEYSGPILGGATIAVGPYFSENPDGTGADRTADFTTAWVSESATNLTYSFTNTGATTSYLWDYRIDGSLATKSPVSDEVTGTGFSTNPRGIKFDFAWAQNPDSPLDWATQLLAKLNTAVKFPTIQIEQRPDIQFTADIFDLITVDIGAYGINDDFRVGKITHDWEAGSDKGILTTLALEPYLLFT